MSQFDYFIKLGYECNHNCVHCSVVCDDGQVYNNTTKNRFSTQEVKNIVDTIPFMKNVCFSGGEPTIRQDILEIISYSRKNHITNIFTNMARFSDKNFTQEAAKYLDSIQGSFHSYNEQIFDNITQRDGSYKQVVKGLENILQENVYIMIVCVINNLNIFTIYDTIKFLRNIVPNIRIHLTAPRLMDNTWFKRDLMPKYDHIKKILPQILDDFQDIVTLGYMPFCCISPSKRYELCFNLSDNNIWNKIIMPEHNGKILSMKETEKGQKVKVSRCKECLMNSKCDGIYKEYVEAYKYELDIFPIK